ncbi:MAG TPA: hypothetical protein VM600_09375 [Actinomycetota bacterium]|nr:hypothetical protein [Actinomycetota bacterium]
MLVHQAALSFELWTGVPAPLEEMARAARAGRSPDQNAPSAPSETV